MTTSRMPRQREVPAPFRTEDYARAAKLPTIYLDEDLRIEYSLSAPELVGLYEVPLDELADRIRRQKCDAWIFLNDEIVGGMQLKRYVIPAFVDNDYILNIMDMDSQQEHELSVALDEQFEDIGEEIGAYGDLVEVNRVWMKPLPSLYGRSSEAVKAVIGAFCPDFAVIVLKAFPLEYEETPDEEDDLMYDAALSRRRRAMMRLYAQTYGVQAMDNQAGNDGWMYRFRDR